MSADNSDEAPNGSSSISHPTRRVSRTIGTGILLVGLAVLAYGAIAFWLIKTLPPNGGASGRLPSLYVMGVGAAVAVIGLIARDLRGRRKESRPAKDAKKGIPAIYGILILLAILVGFFIAVSQM